MQEITSVTIQSQPIDTAPTTPSGTTNNFSQLLEALLGIEQPSPVSLPGSTPASEGSDKAAFADESLVHEILELAGQTDPAHELATELNSATKKSAAYTKSTTTHEANEKESASSISVDSTPQVLPIPVSPVETGQTPGERPEPLMPGLEIQTLTSMPSLEQPVPQSLRLKDFDVKRFEYEIETEPVQMDAPLRQLPQLQAELLQRNAMAQRGEFKPAKLLPDNEVWSRDPGTSKQAPTLNESIAKSDGVQKVQLVFEPPPAPPTVRQVSMDIGDANSQVRVIIHDRNGNLNVQFGAANERLRQELQSSGPLLMRELQRDNPMPVRLDFSNFGSATESDRQRAFQGQAKKSLKPRAEFADAAETSRLPSSSLTPKSI